MARISTASLNTIVRNNLNANVDRLLKVQREVSSGRRLNQPSDDPAATQATMRYRTDVLVSEQQSRTVASVKARLGTADQALGSLTDLLQRARELTIQAGSGSLTTSQLQAIGAELNELIPNAVQIGNTTYGGQYLFAGTKTTTAPFTTTGDPPASVSFNGNTAEIIQDLGQGSQVRVDVRGDQLFQPAIEALIRLRDAITSGDRVTATGASGLGALDEAINGVVQQRGGIGARVNRLEALDGRMAEERTSLRSLQSGLEDTDIADAMVRLEAARTTYQAALGAAAKAIQPSLVDFLR